MFASAIAITCSVSALLAAVGADARWLAALGHVITAQGAIPRGVPFAAASSGGWPNPIALSELLFRWLEQGLGDRGLMFGQVMAVGIAAYFLIRDAVAGGADPRGAWAAFMLAFLGALPALVVIRAQLFSLALFPVLVWFLRREVRRPSRRIWMVLPLLAVWSNLHGAALIGLAVTLVYLAFARFRQSPRTAVALAIAAPISMCVTPAGIHTVAYYHGVLTNEAAQRGQGLWTPLSLGAPLDLVLIVSACALAWRLRHQRPPAWELVVLVGLTVFTVKASRSGVWLVFFLAPLAAPGYKVRLVWNRLLPASATVAVIALFFAFARGPLPTGGSVSLIHRAISSSHRTPVLAEDILAEQVALAGGRIWIGNPIDAFSKHDQDRYLSWLQGEPQLLRYLGARVRVVLTNRGSAAQLLMGHLSDFTLAGSDRLAMLYVRR